MNIYNRFATYYRKCSQHHVADILSHSNKSRRKIHHKYFYCLALNKQINLKINKTFHTATWYRTHLDSLSSSLFLWNKSALHFMRIFRILAHIGALQTETFYAFIHTVFAPLWHNGLLIAAWQRLNALFSLICHIIIYCSEM